jgi:hypothetical protein
LKKFKCHDCGVLSVSKFFFDALLIWLNMMLISATRRSVNSTANIQNVVITDELEIAEMAARVGSKSCTVHG